MESVTMSNVNYFSLQDIVTETSSFDLVAFMPLLREKIYTRNTFSRQFIISWVSVLDAVPDIDIILFLPEILDGLFRILEDHTKEIKTMWVVTNHCVSWLSSSIFVCVEACFGTVPSKKPLLSCYSQVLFNAMQPLQLIK